MGKLLKLELYRLWRDRVFLALLAAIVAVSAANAARHAADLPVVTAAHAALLAQDGMAMFGVLLVAYYCCADFENRTYSRKVSCGYPRWAVLLSKLVLCYATLACATILSTGAVLCLCVPELGSQAGEAAKWLGIRLVTDCGMLSVPVLLACLAKRTIPTLAVGALYGLACMSLLDISAQPGLWCALGAGMIAVSTLVALAVFAYAEL